DAASIVIVRSDDADDDGVADGPRDLWLVALDGSGDVRPLTTYPTGAVQLMSVTTDGQRLIFEARPEMSAKKQVYSVALAGGEPSQVTSPASGESSYFRVLSKDGGTVVFTSNDRADGFGDTEIYTVPVTGGEARLLTDFVNESHFLPFAHLESGQLLYSSPVDGDEDLYA